METKTLAAHAALPRGVKLPCPASTFLSDEASAKVDAIAEMEDRLRSNVLRRLIMSALDKMPMPRKAKV